MGRSQCKELMDKMIQTNNQLKTIGQGWAIYPREVRLRQNKQLILERSDCDQLIKQLTKWLIKHKYEYKHPL